VILLETFVLLLLTTLAIAEKPKLSSDQRQQIIRAFLQEHAYAHRALPRGKEGLVVDGSVVSPSEAEVLQLETAARAGERVDITGIRFLPEGILFEINGGAVKREKWSDRIRMGRPGIGPGAWPDDSRPNKKGSLENSSVAGNDPQPKGAFVLLKLDAPAGITAERVRALLSPVLDFRSTSQTEAYQKNLSPVLAVALRDHRALVGMDREMVLEAIGRPSRRLRESAGGQEYEEWIYGSPPEEVQFIRFVRGKVVRIEQMTVTGEKLVRTADEVGKVEGVLDASAQPAAAASAMAAPAESTSAIPNEPGRREPPTLLRPGEAPAAPK
jgi:hypothetical protein